MNITFIGVNELTDEKKKEIILIIEERMSRGNMMRFLNDNNIINKSKLYKNLRAPYPRGYWRLSLSEREIINDTINKIKEEAKQELLNKVNFDNLISFFCENTPIEIILYTFSYVDYNFNLTLRFSNDELPSNRKKDTNEQTVDSNQFIQFGITSNTNITK